VYFDALCACYIIDQIEKGGLKTFRVLVRLKMGHGAEEAFV
jgi:hypothetical protein